MSHLKHFVDTVRSVYGTKDFIALHEPIFNGKERQYLIDAIDSTFVSSVGKYVDQFEFELAKYTGADGTAAIVNGTSALQVALRVAGVRPGDEVITQALTFVGTANSITYNYSAPVFIDVDYDTMGMSSKALEAFLKKNGEVKENATYNKKTGARIGAIMPMHTFGFMSRIDEIVKIADQWKIPVVEDSAESLGSWYKGQSSGTFGIMGAFSFNGNKIITSGGGGAVVSRVKDFSDKVKYLTNTAKVPHKWEYYHDELGYNFRMPNLNAALILGQMESLDYFIDSKRQIYEHYSQVLKSEFYKVREIPSGTDWNYWLTSIEFNSKEERDSFLSYTNGNGIMTRPIWQLMYKLPMYKNCQRDEQKNASLLSERIVNIPSSARKV